jgi:hypothetical protein
MSKLIEDDAKDFVHSIQPQFSIQLAKRKLDDKIYNNYSSDRNRFHFLTTLRREVKQDLLDHKAKCKNPDCSYEKGSDVALFVIDQELESLESYFSPETAADGGFTSGEKVDMNSKLDEILEKLSVHDAAHQVIFEEIEDLKSHMDLDRKSFSQLVKGKLWDLAFEKGVELVVVQMLWNTIRESLKAGQFFLPE